MLLTLQSSTGIACRWSEMRNARPSIEGLVLVMLNDVERTESLCQRGVETGRQHLGKGSQ